jgi:hypothetical protein
VIQGARDKRELKAITSFLADVGIPVLPLSDNIGHRTTTYLEQHALKDGIAREHVRTSHYTANAKHFQAIGGLDVSVW